MTDKELHKLGRRELLQLLLAQGREAEKAKAKLAETQAELAQLEEGYERLKNRLNDKDAQILQLRESLQAQRQSQGLVPETDLQMDFAQVRGGENLPVSPPPPQRPQPQIYSVPQPLYSPPKRSAAPNPAPSTGKKPRHAQPGAEQRPAPAAPQQGPRVMEVVQIVQGKLQPQSRMLLRPQRVEEGS